MAKKSEKKEVAEIEKAYESITGKKPKEPSVNKGHRGIMIAAAIAAVLISAAVGILYFFPEILVPDRIDVNVSIAGVDVTGMTKKEALKAISSQAEESYTQNTMTVAVGTHTVELTPELSGASLNTEAAVDAALLLTEDTDHLDISPYLNLNEQAILDALDAVVQIYKTSLKHSTYEVIGAVDTATGSGEMKLVINVGTPGTNSDAQMIYLEILNAYNRNQFTVDYPLEIAEPNQPDLELLHSQYSLAPVDAVMDMESFTISSHAFGYTFDLAQAQEALDQAEYDSIVEIPFTVVEPEVFQDDLSAILYRDVLGTYTTTASSRPNGRDVNLALSCQKINGIILYPGDVFDYNKALGERTAASGWKQADGYVDGNTVPVYGGGICQTSSTLYYAALLADIEITTRVNHSFVPSYIPLGMDATVSWGGPEFRFKNSTDYPIRIEAYSSGGSVTVSLIGTDTKDYYVEMEYEVLSTDPYQTVQKEMTAAEANGLKDGAQIVSGYTGKKVISYKCKYSKETDELISREQEATSNYKRRDRVVCKIVESEATPPPEPTDPMLGGSDNITPDG